MNNTLLFGFMTVFRNLRSFCLNRILLVDFVFLFLCYSKFDSTLQLIAMSVSSLFHRIEIHIGTYMLFWCDFIATLLFKTIYMNCNIVLTLVLRFFFFFFSFFFIFFLFFSKMTFSRWISIEFTKLMNFIATTIRIFFWNVQIWCSCVFSGNAPK